MIVHAETLTDASPAKVRKALVDDGALDVQLGESDVKSKRITALPAPLLDAALTAVQAVSSKASDRVRVSVDYHRDASKGRGFKAAHAVVTVSLEDPEAERQQKRAEREAEKAQKAAAAEAAKAEATAAPADAGADTQ